MDPKRKAATYRLSTTALAIIARRAAALSISRTALIELLIRQSAEETVPHLGATSDLGREPVPDLPAERNR